MKLGMNDGGVRGDKQTSNLGLISCPNYTKARGSCLGVIFCVCFFNLKKTKVQVTLQVG